MSNVATHYTTILRTIVGSTVHGLSVSDQDDIDEMGICVEDPRHFFGLRPGFKHHQERTQAEGVRSGPGDLDRITYGLAKWAKLALKGNPTILIPLFAPQSAVVEITPVGKELRAMRDCFIGQSLFNPYLGYMHQQRKRLVTEKKKPNRPELVEKYGFDTKYAGHVIRLGIQGIELATTREMHLPMLEQDRAYIISIRKGFVPLKDVLSYAQHLEDLLTKLKDANDMGEVDRERVEEWVICQYRRLL